MVINFYPQHRIKIPTVSVIDSFRSKAFSGRKSYRNIYHFRCTPPLRPLPDQIHKLLSRKLNPELLGRRRQKIRRLSKINRADNGLCVKIPVDVQHPFIECPCEQCGTRAVRFKHDGKQWTTELSPKSLGLGKLTGFAELSVIN